MPGRRGWTHERPGSFCARACCNVRGVSRVGPHIALAMKNTLMSSPEIDVPASAPRGGVVILDDALDVVACTHEAEELLSGVMGAGPVGSPLPPVVFAVAAALKEVERRDAAALPPSAHVRSRTGDWLDIHAARLNGAQQRGIAVVIEPAARRSIMQIMLSAHGLSVREQEIASHILRGESTREISDALHISAHTVQDHLKKIFDKVGVRSRRDLVARLYARS